MPDSEIHNTDRIGWLRAAVLGANDGIVSTASLVLGVAAAGTNSKGILIAGIAGLVAGAMSMAAGEYVSVSTQRDLELAELERQRSDLQKDPERELQVLARLFEQRGVTPGIAMEVSRQMSAKDALSVHARAELGIDPESVTSPWAAALASLVAFTFGGLVPLVPVVIVPPDLGVPVAGIAVLIALGLTGGIAARLGQMPAVSSIARNVTGGVLAVAITYGIGMLAGTQL